MRKEIFIDRLCSVLACVTAATLVFVRSAAAHGLTPSLVSVLSVGMNGARSVGMTSGAAVRSGSGFRYVCPEAWGGTSPAPFASAPGEPAFVAAETGTFVLNDDGTVVQHPDPLASGRGISLASTGTDVFVLQARSSAYEVLRIDAERAVLLWSDAGPWDSLAAGSDFLELVHASDTALTEVLLSTSGQVLRVEVPLPDQTIFAEARVAGSTPYVLATTLGSSPRELGRIEDQRWQRMLSAYGTIAGPLQTAEGARFVAIDGALGRFDADTFVSLGDSDFVSALGRAGDESYAVVRSGARELSASGLGARLFDWSELGAPDLSLVAAEKRAACSAQWDHLRFDLLSMGVRVAASGDASAHVSSSTDENAGGCAISRRAVGGWANLLGVVCALAWLWWRRVVLMIFDAV